MLIFSYKKPEFQISLKICDHGYNEEGNLVHHISLKKWDGKDFQGAVVVSSGISSLEIQANHKDLNKTSGSVSRSPQSV